jgi:hypothetical protein
MNLACLVHLYRTESEALRQSPLGMEAVMFVSTLLVFGAALALGAILFAAGPLKSRNPYYC